MSTRMGCEKLLVVALLLTGCTTASDREIVTPQTSLPAQYSRTYDYGNDGEWNRILTVLSRSEMYISSTDKITGSIIAERSLVAPPRGGTIRDLAQCGAVSLVERPVHQRAKLSISLRTLGRGSVVSIGAQFQELREGPDGQIRTISCVSTGVLENEMLLRFSQS